MADDIFLTPEEQDERARQWLKDNGPALIVGVVLGIGAIFGWDYYKKSQLEKAEAASSLCITERGAGPHDAFVRAVIKGEDVQIARVPKQNPVVDISEAEKSRKDVKNNLRLGKN